MEISELLEIRVHRIGDLRLDTEPKPLDHGDDSGQEYAVTFPATKSS
jgi:hypothetical protein